MTRTALIVGGSGQIGLATAAALAADGWRVICAHRGAANVAAPGAESLVLDREAPGALARAVGGGVDALIDTIAYDETHARQLLDLEAGVGAMVVISSGSVYRDAAGRTLDEAAEGGFPRLPVPIAESQPTVAPGPATYSTRKAALEQALLQEARTPVTILRPGAIHGPGSRHPREWFFARRALDRRPAVPLAWGGRSRFHTSATANIAELIRVVLTAPATQVLHAADPDPPDVSAIGAAVAEAYGHAWRLAAFEGPPQGPVGDSPWCIPRPIVLDMAAAHALGYRPVTTYPQAVAAACRSAEAMIAAGLDLPPYMRGMFHYAAEDAWLEAHP
jgi:nucleoside-diphosphate-sugar epimerase